MVKRGIHNLYCFWGWLTLALLYPLFFIYSERYLTFLALHWHHHVLNFLIPQQRLLQFLNLTILQRKRRLKPQGGTFFRRRVESLGVIQSKSQLVKCTFSSLAAINDSTAFFILCTSTSSEGRKLLQIKNCRVHMGWIISLKTQGATGGLNTFRPYATLLTLFFLQIDTPYPCVNRCFTYFNLVEQFPFSVHTQQ